LVTLTSFLSRQRLCRKDENSTFVILNKVKNLMHSIRYTTQILRLTPQNDITTQSLKGEEVNDFTAGEKCINAPASRGDITTLFLWYRSELFYG
jgi:hypothetical protein